MFDGVSVIVTTWNRAAQLGAAIERLVAQGTSVPYEVILVDNNSSDATGTVIAEAVLAHPDLVRGAVEPRQGRSYGRNRGIALSRAPVVAFTDDDVLTPADWVETIARSMRQYPDAAAIGGRILPVWATAPPRWLTPASWGPLALLDYGDSPFYVDGRRPLCLLTANVAYRRAALDAVGWFSADFPRCQDHELLLRVWRAGLRGVYVPSLTVMSEVPAERLDWKYHRHWHSNRGRLLARLPDEALNCTTESERPAPMLFDSPAVLYRHLARAAIRTVLGLNRRSLPATREAEAQVAYLTAFIAERRSMWRRKGRGVAPEVVRFLAAWTSRRIRKRRGDAQTGAAAVRRAK